MLHGTRYILDNLITEENFRECPDWIPVQHRQKNVRERLYKVYGPHAMGVLHSLPTIMMDDLRQGEKDELMYDEVPDFYGMVREGMTSTEREEQLRYQTDEAGQVIVETDHEGLEFKLARPIYQLKAYATNPDGPVKANPKSALFWHDDQAIAEIVKAESALGLIIKDKKTTGKTETNQETTMEQGKKVKVMTNRPAMMAGPQPKSAPGPAAKAAPIKMAPRQPVAQLQGIPTGGKVSKPPTRGPSPTIGKTAAPVATQPVGVDMGEIKAAIQQAISTALEPILTSVAEAKDTILSAITIFSDLSAQTGGTYQFPEADENGNAVSDPDGNTVMRPLPQVFSKPNKILSFIDGSAYENEEAGQAEGE